MATDATPPFVAVRAPPYAAAAASRTQAVKEIFSPAFSALVRLTCDLLADNVRMPLDTSVRQTRAAARAAAPKRLTRARAASFRKFTETIVFLERDTLRAEIRRPAFEHVWRDYGSTRPEEVEERLRDATVAVV